MQEKAKRLYRQKKLLPSIIILMALFVDHLALMAMERQMQLKRIKTDLGARLKSCYVQNKKKNRTRIFFPDFIFSYFVNDFVKSAVINWSRYIWRKRLQ